MIMQQYYLFMLSYFSAQISATNQNVFTLGNSTGLGTFLCGVKVCLRQWDVTLQNEIGFRTQFEIMNSFSSLCFMQQNCIASAYFLFTFGWVQKDLAENRFYFLEFRV